MSYLSHSPAATVLASAKAEKKSKHRAASSDCRVTFTLLCFWLMGLLVIKQVASFLRHLHGTLFVCLLFQLMLTGSGN